MKPVFIIVSCAALVGTVAAAIGFFFDALPLERAQAAMLVCAGAWFASAPFWMEHGAAD